MTRKTLWSEYWCAQERTAKPSADSCSSLPERRLLILKLLLELLNLLRHELEDMLKLMELLRNYLKQLLKLLQHL
jgi:hypothetical protein